LFIGLFTLGSTSFIEVPWQGFIEAGNFTDYPIWMFGLLLFFAIGIPFFFLTLLGFKLISPNLKSIGNIAKYTLLAIWLLAVALAIIIGIKQASAFAVEGRVIQKQTLNLKPSDTLLIKFIHNDYFSKGLNDHRNFKITPDVNGNDVIYSRNVNFKIAQTDSKSGYIQIEKEAKGKTFFEAKQRAEKIKYSYKIIGNQLVFDNYLTTELKEKFRDQEIEITLFLPTETLLKTDKSIGHYNETDGDYFSWNANFSDALYKVESNKIKCLNCPNEENDFDEDENSPENDSIVTTTVTVNGKVMEVKETTRKKGLSVNKDGIIIKTY
jgi:hypothetical protein